MHTASYESQDEEKILSNLVELLSVKGANLSIIVRAEFRQEGVVLQTLLKRGRKIH